MLGIPVQPRQTPSRGWSFTRSHSRSGSGSVRRSRSLEKGPLQKGSLERGTLGKGSPEKGSHENRPSFDGGSRPLDVDDSFDRLDAKRQFSRVRGRKCASAHVRMCACAWVCGCVRIFGFNALVRARFSVLTFEHTLRRPSFSLDYVLIPAAAEQCVERRR